MKDEKINPVKKFAKNVKKGGKRMKKGLIAAGAAAVTGLVGVVALAVIGSKQDDDDAIDTEFDVIEDENMPSDDEADETDVTGD